MSRHHLLLFTVSLSAWDSNQRKTAISSAAISWMWSFVWYSWARSCEYTQQDWKMVIKWDKLHNSLLSLQLLSLNINNSRTALMVRWRQRETGIIIKREGKKTICRKHIQRNVFKKQHPRTWRVNGWKGSCSSSVFLSFDCNLERNYLTGVRGWKEVGSDCEVLVITKISPLLFSLVPFV